jgi:hypothetical protein
LSFLGFFVVVWNRSHYVTQSSLKFIILPPHFLNDGITGMHHHIRPTQSS